MMEPKIKFAPESLEPVPGDVAQAAKDLFEPDAIDHRRLLRKVLRSAVNKERSVQLGTITVFESLGDGLHNALTSDEWAELERLARDD